jgi:hypothetical protein
MNIFKAVSMQKKLAITAYHFYLILPAHPKYAAAGNFARISGNKQLLIFTRYCEPDV